MSFASFAPFMTKFALWKGQGALQLAKLAPLRRSTAPFSLRRFVPLIRSVVFAVAHAPAAYYPCCSQTNRDFLRLRQTFSRYNSVDRSLSWMLGLFRCAFAAIFRFYSAHKNYTCHIYFHCWILQIFTPNHRGPARTVIT